MLRWFLALWLIVFAVFSGAVVFDVIWNGGGRYEARDIWGGLLIFVGGGVVWAFVNVLRHLLLAITRRLYGAEPDGPMEGAE